uniref:uncharacterized protein LOC117600108 n=1 Tax=Osmia lignaria TaxID=473952 RepID=UPI0014790499|nr:uncharacterized protein LOC117600108 [Osmia lignaria]
MKRFANDLKMGSISLKQCIVNILSSPNEVLLDFDLQLLSRFSRKNFNEIHDTVGYLFWYPKRFSKTKDVTDNSNWFDFIESIPIIPNYLPTNTESFVTINDYLSCVHVIDNNSSVITWYLFDSTRPSALFYLMFSKLYKIQKRTMINNIIPLENGVFDYPNHMIHIFRYSSNDKNNTKRKCQFEHKKIIELTKNPFIELQLPIIIGSFDQETSKRIFHLVYENDIKPEDLYELLFKLTNILKNMQIESIPIQICNSFNFRLILKMLRFLLSDGNIKIFANLRNSYFPKGWTFWK